jgi:hydroxypyruvate isomerase
MQQVYNSAGGLSLVKASRKRMNRRKFSQLMMGTTGTLLTTRWASAAPAARGVRFSVMLWTLETQNSFDRSIEIVAAARYQGVELVGEFQKWPPEKRRQVMAQMRSHRLVFDSMSGVKAGFAVPQEADVFLAQFAEQLRAAKDLECPQVILLSGNRAKSLTMEDQRGIAVENLKRAAEMATRESIEIVIEPIDLLENPLGFLATVSDGFEIAQAVNAPNVKVLYDFYHEQRSFGNLIEKLEKNIDKIGLIHVADVPGRHEPGTGEIDYATIYRKLADLHYDRWLAMEYYPTREPVASLAQAKINAQEAMRRPSML